MSFMKTVSFQIYYFLIIKHKDKKTQFWKLWFFIELFIRICLLKYWKIGEITLKTHYYSENVNKTFNCFEKEKKKIKCFEKSMLKRPGSPRKRDNTVDFLKIKTYNNQDRIRMQKSI